MKKSESELLREYSRIISEADDQPDGFASHKDSFDDEDKFKRQGRGKNWPPDDEQFDSEEGDPEFNDTTDNDDPDDEDKFERQGIGKNWPPDDEGEPEFNDISDNDDPIAQLSDYLEGLDPHEMTFSEAIQKFLHKHNLELAPKNGLLNKNGEV